MTTSRRRRNSEAGVTLIEMLVVVTIIALFAALVAPRLMKKADDARRVQAKAQIESFMTALGSYKLDTGLYPTTEQGLDALWREPQSDPRPANWHGPYLRKEVPLDPWDHPYVYTAPGEVNPTGYDLLSYGADGQAGGDGDNADITSWGRQ